MIEKQQVIACCVPISRESYHAAVLLLTVLEGVWLCRQFPRPNPPAQRLLTKVGLTIGSA